MSRPNWAVLLVVAALAAGPGPAAAQAQPPQASAAPQNPPVNPKAEALVRRYLSAIHFEGLMDTMMASLIPLMTDTMAKQYPSITTEDRAAIAGVVRDAMRESFVPKMLDRMVPIYAQTFSEPELEAMVAFYESPPGQAIILKTPSLAPKSTEVARELMPEVQQDVLRRLCAKIDCFGGKAKSPPKPRAS